MLSDINSVHTKKWVKALNKEGIDIYLFSLAPSTDDFYDSFENFKSYTAGIHGQQGASFFKKTGYLKRVRQLRRIYREYQPDIVHAHYASSYGLIGSFLKHKPFVMSIWGSDIFEFPLINRVNKFVLKRNLKRADYILSTSEAMALEARKYTQKPIRVIPFGVDTDLFSPRPIQRTDDKFIIGTIKALEPIYGIDHLIRSFKLLIEKPALNRDVELWITGSGTQKKKLMELASSLGLDGKVKFLERIPNEKIPEFFSKIDVVVIPSLIESFGVTAVEALACEKAVLASNVGGLPEIIRDEETGLLMQPGNEEDICEKILQIMNDEDKGKLLGRKGREWVLKKYSWDQNVSQMCSFYSEISP